MADFATVAELEAYMGQPGLGSRGTAMLGRASAKIRAYTHQDLELTLGRQEEYAGEWNRARHHGRPDPRRGGDVHHHRRRGVHRLLVERLSGDIYRTDGGYWTEGPIIVTYDSGYATTEDEFETVKGVCLEVAARALGGPQDTFGTEIPGLAGTAPRIILTDDEMRALDGLTKVTVG